MSDGRKNNRGTPGNKGGRPTKVDEQILIELLTPLDPKALKALENGLEEGHSWAVKLFMAYRYGRPKEIKDTQVYMETPLFEINFKD